MTERRTALVVRHVDHEGVAGFREPIEAAGYAIERIAAYAADWDAVDILAPDLVVVMGGPMGVYDQDHLPWLGAELSALRRRIEANRPVLGVCLGAQLLAGALGARVFKGPEREIGFAPLMLSEAGAASPVRHLEDVPVLHWHGDTFDLPAGVELLARTARYPQAFARGRNLLALQCHPEMGEDPRFEQWLAADAEDVLATGATVAELRDAHARCGPQAVAAGRHMLADWLALLD